MCSVVPFNPLPPRLEYFTKIGLHVTVSVNKPEAPPTGVALLVISGAVTCALFPCVYVFPQHFWMMMSVDLQRHAICLFFFCFFFWLDAVTVKFCMIQSQRMERWREPLTQFVVLRSSDRKNRKCAAKVVTFLGHGWGRGGGGGGGWHSRCKTPVL